MKYYKYVVPKLQNTKIIMLKSIISVGWGGVSVFMKRSTLLKKLWQLSWPLLYPSYHDLNNIQTLSIYGKFLYRTIVLGKKPTYVHSQIQCKQAKLWKTSTALTYDRHLGMHWFLFTKILFAKKKFKKRWKTIVTWQSKSETTFSWWSSYKKDQIFDKNVNNVNEKQPLHARLHGSKH